MRVVAIGGEPSSGKTKLMKAILERLGPREPFQCDKILKGHMFKSSKTIVLGLYDGPLGDFAGTDRLSMAVQPVAERWILDASLAFPDWTVFFEGDRLFNLSFLSILDGSLFDSSFIVLTASEETLKKRHTFRADEQTADWLKGRASKVRNLINSGLKIRIFRHETEADTQLLVSKLLFPKEQKEAAMN